MIDVKEKISVIYSDLGLNLSILKGQIIPIKNCWHFYTAGDSVDVIFHNADEFRDGMNRILPVITSYDVLILAFVLMDTHVHFILYGDYNSCNRFIHEYARRTSIYLSRKYPTRKTLKDIKINHQIVDDDRYLKTAICYVLKNPVSAGLPYNPWDYPWSSGSLYFRHSGYWTSPKWLLGMDEIMSTKETIRKVTKSRAKIDTGIRAVDGVILPSEYVAIAIVEKLFKSHKAFNYFLSASKDIDIESRGGAVSHLTVPMSEMRDIRRMLSEEMFGVTELRRLNMVQRLQLARRMKSQLYCSTKQISKLCGLVYVEVAELL